MQVAKVPLLLPQSGSSAGPITFVTFPTFRTVFSKSRESSGSNQLVPSSGGFSSLAQGAQFFPSSTAG